MKITSIKQYKGSTYEVILDEERKIYLHADIIADFALCSGSELERNELRKIIYASNFRRAFQYALHLLDYRDYSFREMYSKLEKIYKNEKLCLEVMKKLAGIGVINDIRYAEKLARKYIETKYYGYYRAKREMMLKGLDIDTINTALSVYDDKIDYNLSLLIKKKYAVLLTDVNDRKTTEKVKSALVRYGYSFDEVNHAVRDYFENKSLQEDV